MVSGQGDVLGALYGPVRFPWTCSGAGELWAAISALRFKGPARATLVTDYLELKKARGKGRGAGASAANHLGELWSEFWRLVHDIGRESIDVERIPSHRSDAQRLR
eukprot:8869125-Pyramimonas_sp.AAC.1